MLLGEDCHVCLNGSFNPCLCFLLCPLALQWGIKPRPLSKPWRNCSSNKWSLTTNRNWSSIFEYVEVVWRFWFARTIKVHPKSAGTRIFLHCASEILHSPFKSIWMKSAIQSRQPHPSFERPKRCSCINSLERIPVPHSACMPSPHPPIGGSAALPANHSTLWRICLKDLSDLVVGAWWTHCHMHVVLAQAVRIFVKTP